MDCFFAAVEMRDNPKLRHVPLAVGGDSPRSVLSTCNYQARKYGIRSAMPSTLAKRICPDLVIVPGSFAKYKEASLEINAIFQDYSDLIQPLSLDEAFIEVTGKDFHQGSATLMAKEIKQRIFGKTKLTASAGIAPNKFLAKIASDWKKPDGLFTVPPHQVDAFVKELPVQVLPGVGPVTAQKLHDQGIFNCSQIREMGEDKLKKKFGSFSERLLDYSYGVDHSLVKTDSLRKSVSVERTYLKDKNGFHSCRAELGNLLKKAIFRLERWEEKEKAKGRHHLNPLKGISLKMRTHDFKTITLDRKLPKEELIKIWRTKQVHQSMESVLDELTTTGLQKLGNQGLRLLGIGFKLEHKQVDTIGPLQLSLFPDELILPGT